MASCHLLWLAFAWQPAAHVFIRFIADVAVVLDKVAELEWMFSVNSLVFSLSPAA
jgi:hypothetical protein